MHHISMAAAFIRANMPLCEGGSLSNQQLRDVDYYMSSHKRPQDPRFNVKIRATKDHYHQHLCRYGNTVDNHTLGKESESL
jgi:thiosulfate dehydrogenase